MIQLVRSLFGWTEEPGNRMVAGLKTDVDLKEVTFIRNSKVRIKELRHLHNRYKGTPHEAKVKAVCEKTEIIHDYLEAKKRGHELELFHLRNTDHFITTFTVILDVYQQQKNNSASVSRNGKAYFPEKSKQIITKHNQEAYRNIEMVQTVTVLPDAKVPQLLIADISIDTSAKVLYYKEDNNENLISREIGYNSSDLEKEGFLQYVSACLGIRNIAYLGNALVTITNNNGSQPTGLVPIIHWEGFLYALNLNDYRLFPVRLSRK